MKEKDNEMMVPASSEGFLKLVDVDLADNLSEELAGMDLSFERVKIPTGGSTVFEIPGDDSNDTVTVRSFKAVILYHHPVQAFYKSKYSGGNLPPDCGSFDGITGQGEPGGACSSCQYNKFGSGENGSKACKERRRIYLLTEGSILPVIITLPTGSIKEFNRYVLKLFGKGQKTGMVVTKFTLRKATNSGGIAYSQAQFSVDRMLTAEELKVVAKVSEDVRYLSGKISYEVDGVDENENPFVDVETGEILDKFR
ncbi:hypothetical protein [Youngiibacter fragilis]|uniref:Uncharacterized protein n=1 Tax=Youngiibacter fragilis 232.1 TaxID=994573 RepID=V7I3J6_9CLOT|nr:hypothetical protein [Youngiibacter fragilis]ETA80443.1 hypothetical protein T472_0211815 [Youngiibacter fragilis 232.1]